MRKELLDKLKRITPEEETVQVLFVRSFMPKLSEVSLLLTAVSCLPRDGL